MAKVPMIRLAAPMLTEQISWWRTVMAHILSMRRRLEFLVRAPRRNHPRLPSPCLPLFPCCARQDGSHQLRGGLTGRRSLAPQFPKDVRRKWNIGNEQRSRRQPVGHNLLLQNADELAHAAPSLSRGEPRFAGYDTTVRGNQHILHIAPRDIGVADLQPVDRIVDLVGEVDAVFGGEQAATGCVANKIRNPPRTNFRTLQIFDRVALYG